MPVIVLAPLAVENVVLPCQIVRIYVIFHRGLCSSCDACGLQVQCYGNLRRVGGCGACVGAGVGRGRTMLRMLVGASRGRPLDSPTTFSHDSTEYGV